VHHAWPLNDDLLHPPQHQLTLCIPLDIISQWHDDCSSASVVNCDLLQGPTLSVLQDSVSQGHCGSCCKLWGLADSDLCTRGVTQTMSHIVESSPLTKLDGRLKKLHTADDEWKDWLSSYGT